MYILKSKNSANSKMFWWKPFFYLTSCFVPIKRYMHCLYAKWPFWKMVVSQHSLCIKDYTYITLYSNQPSNILPAQMCTDFNSRTWTIYLECLIFGFFCHHPCPVCPIIPINVDIKLHWHDLFLWIIRIVNNVFVINQF